MDAKCEIAECPRPAKPYDITISLQEVKGKATVMLCDAHWEKLSTAVPDEAIALWWQRVFADIISKRRQ